MKIQCPQCSSEFEIPDQAFKSGKPRDLICSNCEHQWTVDPNKTPNAKDIPVGEDTEMVGDLLAMKDGKTPDRLRPAGSHNLMDDDVASIIDNADPNPDQPKENKPQVTEVKSKDEETIDLRQVRKQQQQQVQDDKNYSSAAVAEFMSPLMAKILPKISKNPLKIYSKIKQFNELLGILWRKTFIYKTYSALDSFSNYVSTLMISWLMFGFFIIFSIIFLIGWRDFVVDIFPEMEPVYAFTGIGHDVLGKGLELSLPNVKLDDSEDVQKLEIAGEVTNQSAVTQEVPLMLGTLEDENQVPLFIWVFRTQKEELKPGETTEFLTVLTRFPNESRKLVITFTTPEEAGSLIALQ